MYLRSFLVIFLAFIYVIYICIYILKWYHFIFPLSFCIKDFVSTYSIPVVFTLSKMVISLNINDVKINHGNPWKWVVWQALVTPIQNPKWLPSPGTMAWQPNSLQCSGAESWVCCCHDLSLTLTCCHDSKIHTTHSIQMQVIKTDHMPIIHPIHFKCLLLSGIYKSVSTHGQCHLNIHENEISILFNKYAMGIV